MQGQIKQHTLSILLILGVLFIILNWLVVLYALVNHWDIHTRAFGIDYKGVTEYN